MLRVSKAWTEGVGDSVIPCRISWTEVLCRLGLLVICHICLSNVPKSMVKEADYWVKSLVKLYLMNIMLFSALRTYHRALQFLLFVESGFCPLSLCVIQMPGTWNADWGPEGPTWPSLVPDSSRLRRKIPKSPLVEGLSKNSCLFFLGGSHPVLCKQRTRNVNFIASTPKKHPTLQVAINSEMAVCHL